MRLSLNPIHSFVVSLPQPDTHSRLCFRLLRLLSYNNNKNIMQPNNNRKARARAGAERKEWNLLSQEEKSVSHCFVVRSTFLSIFNEKSAWLGKSFSFSSRKSIRLVTFGVASAGTTTHFFQHVSHLFSRVCVRCSFGFGFRSLELIETTKKKVVLEYLAGRIAHSFITPLRSQAHESRNALAAWEGSIKRYLTRIWLHSTVITQYQQEELIKELRNLINKRHIAELIKEWNLFFSGRGEREEREEKGESDRRREIYRVS